ncbi:MAG: trehalose-6-phosphate synthase [Planctomycetes bacterium]|nr:trehalose-6-phosphate synthase [Planctomycetota bacterium]
MTNADRPRLPRGTRIGLLIAAVVGLTTGAMAWFQVQRERRIDEEDLDRRAHATAHQMSWFARQTLALPDSEAADEIEGRLGGYRRVLGFALYRADGRVLASGAGVSEFDQEIQPQVERALKTRSDVSEAVRSRDALVHVLAYLVKDPKDSVQGVLVVLHDMEFIEQRAMERLVQFGFWVLLVTLLMVVLVAGSTWLLYERPLRHLAEWMQRVRTDDAPEAPPRGLPVALLASESGRLAASFRAARSAGWRDSHETVREHNLWTRERLRAHAIDCLEGRQLVVVSNREPYMHQFRNGAAEMIVPAGGLVTALDPVLQACGGLWVAHDYGLSNEGLWPLCHLAHERPVFREADWAQYQHVNRRFADCVLEEIGSGKAAVLVQDYQLALVPGMLKAARPDLQVGIFWHIPWPNPEAFRICPWRAEILHGMLGADVIGFHLQQHCNNFLDTVDRMVEARLDWDHFAAEVKGRCSLVRPFPISIEGWAERDVPSGAELAEQIRQLREQHKLGDTRVVVGVERIDYTKGLPERLRAFDRFLHKYPQYRGKLTFVLLGAPSRTHLRRYRDLVADLESAANEINWKHQTDSWRPMRMLITHHNAAAVHAFLAMADGCVVSSLHDGMNLVAKEYVSAKADGEGALVLSEFAGAARELTDALLINPYDTEQFADAIDYALSMPPEERRQRMSGMQASVRDHNVYRWAAGLLTSLANSQGRVVRTAPATAADLTVFSAEAQGREPNKPDSGKTAEAAGVQDGG